MKFLLLGLVYSAVFSAEAEQSCKVDELAQYTYGQVSQDGNTYIEANTLSRENEVLTLTGEVQITRQQAIIKAEKLTYAKQTGDVQSDVPLTYGEPGFALHSTQSAYNTQSETGIFSQADYYLSTQGANGHAEQVVIDRKNQFEVLENATYTTCERADPAWQLKASRLYLDHAKQEGEAWHSKFYIGDTPVFYFPYLTFNLTDARKSGWLIPNANVTTTRGLDVTLPYYFNLAPNLDATFSPRLMSKRGLMLGGELRYLNELFYNQVSGNYLFDDRQSDRERWEFRYQGNYHPVSDLNVNFQYARISDKSYIEDFNQDFDLSSDSFLESYLNAYYKVAPNYDLLFQVQEYQVATARYQDVDRPYRRLPRISGQGEWIWANDVMLSNQTEATWFEKDNAVTGGRLHNELLFSYTYETSYSFLTPAFVYYLSHYDLHDQDPDKSSQITRSIPSFSLDYGVFFDRQATWFSLPATQTLEPRIFYLYTAYEDQSDIPNFDTSLIDSSYDWLFLRNRFYGKDRIGDANQLTMALSSRTINNNNGRELAKFAIGQIYYFADRQVSLNDSVSQQTRSEVIGEASVALNAHTQLTGLVHYDSETWHNLKSSLAVSYQPEADKAIRIAHYYDDEYYKQMDISGVYRINDNYRLFGRWNYSIEYDKSIDVLAGIEYSDCCWAVRLLLQHEHEVLDSDDSEQAVYLEFVLKGLGNVGTTDTSGKLSEVIPSYRPLKGEK